MQGIDPAATAWLLASTALVLLMTPGLAIFYGAGHMTNMQEQMEKRFDMRPVSAEWVEAWDLRAK